ncbi:hypothetical protein ACJJTC_008296 [Scirpophaga incertulas]
MSVTPAFLDTARPSSSNTDTVNTNIDERAISEEHTEDLMQSEEHTEKHDVDQMHEIQNYDSSVSVREEENESEAEPLFSEEEERRRILRDRATLKSPLRFDNYVMHIDDLTGIKEPKTYQEAVSGPGQDGWCTFRFPLRHSKLLRKISVAGTPWYFPTLAARTHAYPCSPLNTPHFSIVGGKLLSYFRLTCP